MLRKQLIVLSVMTSLTLSGCSKNESVSDIEKTNNDISVETTEAPIAPGQETIISEEENLITPEDKPDLVHYTVPGGEYSEQCGFKNEAGDVIVKAEYDFCGGFNEGMAYLLKKNMKSDSDGGYYIGYVNSSGEIVIPVDIAADYGWMLDARDFSEGLVAVLKKDKWGYMDKKGNTVISFEYETASDFSNGLATVSKDYKYGAINHNGKEIITLKYGHLGEFEEGLAAFNAVDSDKQGFINTKGKVIVDPVWNQAMPFSEGLAAVAKGDYENAKWGFIDTTAKVVIEPKYDYVSIDPGGDSPDVIGGYFKNGTIEVYQENENGQVTAITIDKNGKELKRKNYDYLSDVLEQSYN
ncbi:WG repeat-containing protein [Psychrobacter fulvigenes]|uniref:WG repeat-containing protein n=1 Tax=Psychrobacter fulvigenes TaxID=533323 RepID=UPI00191AFA45|nr:WG repeat-containing protein [Psychrobacter fulvigenes]